jgi:multidrug resistance efflux pump
MTRAWKAGLVFAAALAFAGCKRPAQEAAEERRELAQEQQETQEDIARIQQEAQEDIAEERQELAEKREDVAEAEREAREERFGERREGMEGTTASVIGRVESTFGDQIKIRDQAGREIELNTDDSTRVMMNGREVKVDELKEGTQVRASYAMDGDDRVAKEVQVLSPGQGY